MSLVTVSTKRKRVYKRKFGGCREADRKSGRLMASWTPEYRRRDRRSTLIAVFWVVVLLAAYVLACTLDARSLNPENDCRYGQIRDARGVCR